MYEKTYPSKRFNITLDFLKKHITRRKIFVKNCFKIYCQSKRHTDSFSAGGFKGKTDINKKNNNKTSVQNYCSFKTILLMICFLIFELQMCKLSEVLL